MSKWVYIFGGDVTEGQANMKDLLGGKGANLAEMCSLGLPVPPGFTISTSACSYYYSNRKTLPDTLEKEIFDALVKIEKIHGNKFGCDKNPLLVSVRSGSRASMPGMMDTILNLGLNDKTVIALAKHTNNERFAFDSYRRFIQMYSDVVLGLDHDYFEYLFHNTKIAKKAKEDADLTSEDLKTLCAEYKNYVKEVTGNEFPQDVTIQLMSSIRAVFESWLNSRAITYRKIHNIPEDWGTAVNIQSMVFGNMGNDCATGVAFTRDPSTGERIFYGEYLINAQGEDVVAGIRTPQAISIASRNKFASDLPSMEETMPAVYQQLVEIYQKLEQHYKDMQDIEFTVQNGELWILQTRSGKRSARAAVKIAVDMVREGLISKEEAIKRINPLSLDQLLHPIIDTRVPVRVIAKGLPASPGVVSGIVAFSAEDTEEKSKSHNVILVRTETSPEDIKGMHAASGILTARGGMTSHAAVVARGMGKTCVCGASSITIDHQNKQILTGGFTIKEGDTITINGSSGEIILGEIATIQPELSEEFETLMGWADQMRLMKVRANAETLLDINAALKFGAEGIGLCRTEHMFFEENRITAMREMIVSDTTEKRQKALNKLLPMQRDDFVEILTLMNGLPVNIRLLDPPLHEFLPHNEDDIRAVAENAGISFAAVRESANNLHETNPMLGHRGCRLGISHPEIYAMQARAIFEALMVVEKKGIKSNLEIMIPLILSRKEMEILKNLIDQVAKEVETENGCKLNYQVGTMIELPRAALKAGEIAELAEYFSFGTNDLTQTTLGISRDDARSFLNSYKESGIMPEDPFVSLDIEGVGELMKIAVERGRTKRANIKLGICGEHGGHPSAIHFCQTLGMNYVSCSPYRIPIARLAAAQAAIMFNEQKS